MAKFKKTESLKRLKESNQYKELSIEMKAQIFDKMEIS